MATIIVETELEKEQIDTIFTALKEDTLELLVKVKENQNKGN